MLKLQAPPLSAASAKSLRVRQRHVNDAGSYADQVAEAKRLFAQHNKRGDAAFDEVKQLLDRTCPGIRRCHYCQDSCADEVEHMRPKDLYPREVFQWANYLYACGPCNGPKNNRYAVIIKRRLVDHPTVWSEMKRQRASYRELNALFAAAPEALRW